MISCDCLPCPNCNICVCFTPAGHAPGPTDPTCSFRDSSGNEKQSHLSLERIFGMADLSVSSPRQMLSLSRERVSVALLEETTIEVNNKQGAKLAEAYGFVGSVSTIFAAGLFFVWAYLPELWLHHLGITYYPSRYWALAIPAYAIMFLFFIVIFYLSLNGIATVSPTAWNSLFDERTICTSTGTQLFQDRNYSIDPISDIPITEINAYIFGS